MAVPIALVRQTFRRTIALLRRDINHLPSNVSVRCAPRVSLGTMHTKEEPGTTSTDSAAAFDSGKEATSAPEFVMGTLHEALKFQYLTMHANPTQSPVGTEYSDDSKQDTINDVPVTESSNEAPFFAMNADFKLTDLELKAILLNKCIEEFQKDIPSYRLDALKTVDDVIAFFSEPAPLFARTGEKPEFFDLAQKKDEFPPNLHLTLANVNVNDTASPERYRKKDKTIPKKHYRKYK